MAAAGDSAAGEADAAAARVAGARPLLKKGQQVLVLATVQQDFGSEIAVSLEDWWPTWSEILVSSWRITPLPVRTMLGVPLVPPSGTGA
jgi:hypothetical protein